MKCFFILLLCPLALWAADDEAPWSPVVKGVRGRLFIAPCHEAVSDATFEVCVQFENVGVVGSLGAIREDRAFPFSAMNLDLSITDANGHKLPRVTPGEMDEFVPGYNLTIPFGGNLAFPIGYGWSTVPKYATSQDGQLTPAMLKGRYFNITKSMGWIIPMGTHQYFLAGIFSGKLTTEARGFGPGSHGVDSHFFDTRQNWDDKLEFPAIKVPIP